MKRASKLFLGLDVFALVACSVFLLDNYFALRRVYAVWGDNFDELGWSRHPLTSVTWPPFWGKEHLIPQGFVGVALIGCFISSIALVGFLVVWVRRRGKLAALANEGQSTVG